jgi:release factor glutamine methyltransferase
MPNPTPEPPPAELVARLRAAGCVYAADEAAVLTAAAPNSAALEAMVERRVAGEPLEQVVGWAEFGGRTVALAPGVFVPRHRTELLVAEAAALASGAEQPVVVLDLCCGSGALAAALVGRIGPVEVHAADIDPTAVRCARRNLPGASVYEGDLYDALPPGLRGRVGLLLANAPYVPSAAVALLPPEARLHEPRVALDGGADGLDVLRRVAEGAVAWLAPGGHVLAECSDRQAPALRDAFRRSGLAVRLASDDDIRTTVLIGTRRAG